MTTVHMAWAASTEMRRQYASPSPHLRAQALRDGAAALNRRLLSRRPAKQFAPLLSPQKVSDAMHRGGGLGDLCVQMLADPLSALTLAKHALGVARSITAACSRPLTVVLSEEARADSAEDVAQDDLRAAETLDTLTAYIEAADEALAALQAARDAAASRRAEILRGDGC